jgi:RNA polymerase sigma-70 factor (ECF subfamily)
MMNAAVTSHPPPGSDAAAVAASRRDPRAFVALFDRHYDAVHAFLRRRLGDEAGEELAAETFAVALDRRSTYDLAYPDARPWLFGIASRLALRRHREEERRLRAYGREAARAATGDADTDVGGASLTVVLVDALLALRPEEREPLLLLAWADLSYEEIARCLDVPVGTVRSRLARGRARLQAELGVDAVPARLLEASDA